MRKGKESAIDALNGLIQTCKDGQTGYETAVEGTDNDELREVFNQYADQCREFADELKEQVLELGGTPEEPGRSMAARAFHGWMNIKAAVTGRDDKAIISECERGEDVRKKSYEDALKKELPTTVKLHIQTQYEEVKAAHDRIRGMERLRKGS